MSVPSLVQISCQAVSQWVLKGKIVLNKEISEKLTNEILEEIMKRRIYIMNSVNFSNWNITKFNFDKMKCISAANVAILSKLELETFKFDGLHLLRDELRNIQSLPALTIVNVVAMCLNEKSRMKLRHLAVGDDNPFPENWLDEIFNMVPNVVTLSITNGQNPFSFPKLEKPFHQLRCLDLTNILIHNLHGISMLKNLEVLIMPDMEIGNSDDLRELFCLEKLKVLDISQTIIDEHSEEPGIMTHFLELNQSLPELKFLDCSNIQMDRPQLNNFIGLHPNLQEICLFGTLCSNVSLPGIVVLSTTDLRSAIDVFYYFDKLDRVSKMEEVLRHIPALLASKISYKGNKKLLDELLELLISSLKKSQTMDYDSDDKDLLTIQCLCVYSKQYIQHTSVSERLDLLDCLLKTTFSPSPFWEIINCDEILGLQDLDTLKLCQRAIDDIVEYDFDNFEHDFVARLMMVLCKVSKRCALDIHDNIQNLSTGINNVYKVAFQLVHGGDENEPVHYNLLYLVLETLKTLLQSSSYAVEPTLFVELVQFLYYLDENPLLKFQVTRVLEKVILLIDNNRIPNLFSPETVAILLLSLHGDYEKVDEGTAILVDAGLAFKCLSILAQILGRVHNPNDELGMIPFLINYIQGKNPETLLVPFVRSENFTERFLYEKVDTVEEWAAMTVRYLNEHTLIVAERNFYLFMNRNNTMGVIRNIHGNILNN